MNSSAKNHYQTNWAILFCYWKISKSPFCFHLVSSLPQSHAADLICIWIYPDSLSGYCKACHKMVSLNHTIGLLTDPLKQSINWFCWILSNFFIFKIYGFEINTKNWIQHFMEMHLKNGCNRSIIIFTLKLSQKHCSNGCYRSTTVHHKNYGKMCQVLENPNVCSEWLLL